MKKILWLDVETGGVDEKTDALLQLSALVEVDGVVVDEIDLKIAKLS
jgi:oligoribonuclease (3'-5' exoribonuclease)